MFAVIVATDQLIFRPLVAWAERFKFEFATAREMPHSWLLELVRRSRLLPLMAAGAGRLWNMTLAAFRRLPAMRVPVRRNWLHRGASMLDRYWGVLAVLAGATALISLFRFVHGTVDLAEVASVFALGLATAMRVVVLIALASLIWVPIGIWIGLDARWSQRLQPLVIFLAAFPANLLFPLAVYAIIAWHLNPEIWLSPLMILGTQWYILFNVIGAASALPADLREAAASTGLKSWRLWQRVLLPAALPAYVTGGLTASGGAWNASVVAEVVSWGSTTLTASGIGSYIAAQTAAGDHPRIALGVAVMSLYVILLNRMVWEKLYAVARERFSF